MSIMDVPTDRDLTSSTPSQHLADHVEIALRVNAIRGPFRLAKDTPGIDTGVTLFTPEVGERIIGVWAEFSEAFSSADERLGIGIAETVNADLGYVFDVPVGSLPAAPSTWPCERGYGIPYLGLVTTITQDSVPLIARTLVGSNTTGIADLYVAVLRSGV